MMATAHIVTPLVSPVLSWALKWLAQGHCQRKSAPREAQTWSIQRICPTIYQWATKHPLMCCQLFTIQFKVWTSLRTQPFGNLVGKEFTPYQNIVLFPYGFVTSIFSCSYKVFFIFIDNCCQSNRFDVIPTNVFSPVYNTVLKNFLQIWNWTARLLTLYSIDTHFNASTTDNFWKNCGKRRNCS